MLMLVTARYPILMDAIASEVQRKGDVMMSKWAEIMTCMQVGPSLSSQRAATLTYWHFMLHLCYSGIATAAVQSAIAATLACALHKPMVRLLCTAC